MESTKQPAAGRMIVAYHLPLRPSRWRTVLDAARNTAPPKSAAVNVYRRGIEVIKSQRSRHE